MFSFKFAILPAIAAGMIVFGMQPAPSVAAPAGAQHVAPAGHAAQAPAMSRDLQLVRDRRGGFDRGGSRPRMGMGGGSKLYSAPRFRQSPGGNWQNYSFKSDRRYFDRGHRRHRHNRGFWAAPLLLAPYGYYGYDGYYGNTYGNSYRSCYWNCRQWNGPRFCRWNWRSYCGY